MLILLTLKVRKQYMFIIIFVKPGVEAQSTQVCTLWHFWHRVSTTLKIYEKNTTYTMSFVKTGLKSINGI